MPRIVFDKDIDRVVEMGVSEGILSVLTEDGYSDPVAWNGLTSVSNTPEGGEVSEMYADNMVYATTTSTEKFGGTIECYTYPDAFAACDGSVSYSGTGAKFGGSFNMQKRSKFGFAYKTNANDAAGNEFEKLHIIWNAQANPTERTYETVNDSPEGITFSYEFSCVGVKTNKTFAGETLKKATSHFEIPSKVQVAGVWTENPVYAAIEEKLYGKGITESDPNGEFPDIDTLIGWIDDAMKPADSSAE